MHTSLLTAAETRAGGQTGWEPALPTRVSATGRQFYSLVSTAIAARGQQEGTGSHTEGTLRALW